MALHGPEDLDVAKTHNNMGVVYEAQGKYEEALEAYSKSLHIKIKVVGQDSPHVADTKYNIAGIHKERGEKVAAKKFYLECETIYAKVYGPDHSETTDAAQKARDCA